MICICKLNYSCVHPKYHERFLIHHYFHHPALFCHRELVRQGTPLLVDVKVIVDVTPKKILVKCTMAIKWQKRKINGYVVM